MSKDYSIELDLIRSKKINLEGLKEIKGSLMYTDLPADLKESISESISECNDGDFLEIYLEDFGVSENCQDEVYEFITNIEEIVGDFDTGSSFVWIYNFPFQKKTWLKEGFMWTLDDQTEEEDGPDVSDWEGYKE
jgi:hypothetical protein